MGERWNILYEICLGKNETRQTRIGSYVLPSHAWDSLNHRPNPNRLGRGITDSGNSGQFALSLEMGTWLHDRTPSNFRPELFEAQTSSRNTEPIKSREWQQLFLHSINHLLNQWT